MTKRTVLILALLALVAGLGVPRAAASARGFYPIAYMSVRNDNGDVHVLNGTADTAVRGADSNGHDCGPAFKPGGHLLAFESNRSSLKRAFSASFTKDDLVGGDFEIYLVNLDSGKVRQLTTSGGAFPSWSPDGRRIVYSNGTSLVVMSADGSHARQITLGSSSSAHVFPAWSPDGRKIAFSVTSEPPGNPHLHASQIYDVDPNGGNVQLLTADGEFPAWSPDSKRIVFDSARNGSNPFDTDLYTMNADGSHQIRIESQDGSEVMPSWSPDGKHIAYTHNDQYWTGVVEVGILPIGMGYEVWPTPSNIWELTLGSNGRAASSRQMSTGTTDAFPRYSPVRNPM